MDRYRIFRRGRTWYLENAATGKQTSLHTRDRREALRVLHAKHEAQENPSINVQIARAYLHVADAGYTTRKWSDARRYRRLPLPTRPTTTGDDSRQQAATVGDKWR